MMSILSKIASGKSLHWFAITPTVFILFGWRKYDTPIASYFKTHDFEEPVVSTNFVRAFDSIQIEIKDLINWFHVGFITYFQKIKSRLAMPNGSFLQTSVPLGVLAGTHQFLFHKRFCEFDVLRSDWSKFRWQHVQTFKFWIFILECLHHPSWKCFLSFECLQAAPWTALIFSTCRWTKPALP